MKAEMTDSGNIFEIERFAINDGPGIRTLVFLKGCPLTCQWCANPESQSSDSQLMYWKTRCIGCQTCLSICPNQALSWSAEGIVIDRIKCKSCGTCSKVCNSEALTIVGERLSVEEVLEQVAKDEIFYESSNGGVTFSGGEVLYQSDYLALLAKECKNRGYHTCIETSGHASWFNLSKVAPYIDLFLFDIKSMNEKLHKEYIGVSNKKILSNYQKLIEAGKKVITRVPIIPGFNNNYENLEQLVDFLTANNPHCRIDLLPYHRLGVSKYERLNMEYQFGEFEPPSSEEMAEYQSFLTGKGFKVTIGG
ncbi:glycyl-radical enzyme activating protein [Enterococcus hulanensis]|uniref:glycyl-radical enzyme activating protein n=1 Tax=Enterococcus hulanensis TaxID=2559929 RepID=UPI001A8DC4BD|nr:glycyl-radical enzyme activating protein [Enterococcus hulanensis]MBO0457726.1 glycyl-radical enzyme activating protein [Enterococcus hulanensis]